MTSSSQIAIRNRFARRLKQARWVSGFRTARSFAQALNIEEGRYTRWERAEVEPSFDMIVRICELLSLTPDDLLISEAALAINYGKRQNGVPPPSTQ